MSKSATAAILCLILAFSFALRSPGFFEKLNWDEGMYAYIGSQIMEGKTPHRDMPGDKEAGIFFLYASAFKTLGNNSLSIRILCAVWVTFAALLVFIMGRELFGVKGALFATFFFGLSMAGIQDSGILANSEIFMVLPSLLAYFLALMAVRKGRSNYLFWSGLAIGFSFTLKVTAVLDMAGVTAFLFIASVYYRKDGREPVSPMKGVALAMLGFVLALAPVIAYLAYKGALADAWDQVFLRRFAHIEQSYGTLAGSSWDRFIGSYSPVALESAGLIAAAFASSIFILLKDRKKENLMLVAWAVLALSSIFITGRFSRYYFPFAVPALALLAGYGLSRFAGLSFLGAGWVPRAAVAVFLVLSIFSFYDENAYYYKDFVPGLVSLARGETSLDDFHRMMHPDVASAYDAGRYVRENSAPSDRVFFWDSSGEFYWEARRPRPTRYLQGILPGGDRQAERQLKDEIYHDLLKDPPRFFVVRDIVMYNAFPPYRPVDTLTGDMKAFLENNYVLDKVFGRAIVYRKTDKPGPLVRSLVFFPEYMMPNVGYPLHGDWFMYSNGSMSLDFVIPAERQVSISVRAKGTRALGEYPAIRLDLDGKEVGVLYLQAPDWEDYQARTVVPAGSHKLTLEYFNDASDSRTHEDRDLYVGMIVLQYDR